MEYFIQQCWEQSHFNFWITSPDVITISEKDFKPHVQRPLQIVPSFLAQDHTNHARSIPVQISN